MHARFLHLADVHLGYQQYNSTTRYDDFAKAFLSILGEANKCQVDAVLIAGDLFNKRAIDARTLAQAFECLRELKERAIPVIAIEGNHDRSYYRDGMSWLKFLSAQKMLCLLDPIVREGTPELAPWNTSTQRGAYLDLMDGRLRVYGLPWFGASTTRLITSMADALSRARAHEAQQGVEYRVLMMHTGIEGEVPRLHGLPTRMELEPLHGLVDYLALGHVHKPYEVGGWIYNPGSPETCSAEEVDWPERGYYDVEVESERIQENDENLSPPRHRARLLANPRRPYHRLKFRVDGLDAPDLLIEGFVEFCRYEAAARRAMGPSPVIEVQLQGVLNFDVSALDEPRLEEIVKAQFQPLLVRLHNTTRDVEYDPDDEGLDGRDRSNWHLLERKIFEELLARDARYRPAAGQWAEELARLKDLALEGEDPAVIASRLREARARLLPQPGAPSPEQ